MALGPNGDLLGTVASEVPSLYAVFCLQFDRTTQMLGLGTLSGVARISAKDGHLLQTYDPSNCFTFATQVTRDGLIWLAMDCWGDGERTATSSTP